MVNRKATKKYYFSVEGETEHWYLKWLQELINANEEARYKVSFECPVNKNPYKYVKKLNVLNKTEIYHFFDYEDDEDMYVKRFKDAMDNMKKAQTTGKQITYKSGYSNLTFDLWVILHMANCNGSYAHRKNYLTPINRVFGESFESMDEFKKEDNFKRCLKKLKLSNVIDAVKRAKIIMEKNKDNGYKLHEYKGYKYYKENPALAVWEVIEKILKDCELV